MITKLVNAAELQQIWTTEITAKNLLKYGVNNLILTSSGSTITIGAGSCCDYNGTLYTAPSDETLTGVFLTTRKYYIAGNTPGATMALEILTDPVVTFDKTKNRYYSSTYQLYAQVFAVTGGVTINKLGCGNHNSVDKIQVSGKDLQYMIASVQALANLWPPEVYAFTESYAGLGVSTRGTLCRVKNWSIERSTNCMKWTSVDTSAIVWIDVVFGNGFWLAQGDSGATRKVYKSTDDGLTWTECFSGGGENGKTNMRFIYDRFITWGGTGVKHSIDGVTWTNIAQNATDICYGLGLWMFVIGGRIYSTPNLIDFTARDAYGQTVACNGYNFCTGATSGSIYNSIDGLSWTSYALPGTTYLSSISKIVGGDGMYVAQGNVNGPVLIASSDGSNWYVYNRHPSAITCAKLYFDLHMFWGVSTVAPYVTIISPGRNAWLQGGLL